MKPHPRRFGNSRLQKPAGSFGSNSERNVPSAVRRQWSMSGQSARKNYERYLELARAAAGSGDTIAAENYYQYAEHYYRSMQDPNS